MSNPAMSPPATPAAEGTAGSLAMPRQIPFDAPWSWLAAGWRDMWQIPHLSLTYGAVFAISAAVLAIILWTQNWLALFIALAGGFLLLGPMVGAGFYDASRRLAAGQPVSLKTMVTAGFRARGQLVFFGAVLLFAYLLWVRLAFLMLMLFLGTGALPPPAEFMSTLLFSQHGLALLIAGTLVGGCIAALVFVISVVAVPDLLVRPVDAVSAARSSIRACAANPKPMMLWAGLIAMMMASGFATAMLGLVVAFPLIGHATWHAYCDLTGYDQTRTTD